MRLLVLGGSQFLGRAIVDEACSRGYDVTTFSRGRSGHHRPGTETLTGDRTNPEDLRQLARGEWDAVIDTSVLAPAHVAASARILAESKVDALIGFPPVPQELREKKIGHVVVNSGLDRPWSQYFCCVIGGTQEFVSKNPVATKRVLRAILKATHLCSTEPERAARIVADRGYRYDYSLQTMKEIRYALWREYDPEDAVRYYALRLREAGMIKSGPNRIIAQGTDWRFFNELRRELKA